MKLSAHFSLEEFTRSSMATSKGIDNTLPEWLYQTAIVTTAMMERIRTHLCSVAGHDVPISISSGYRCPALNAAVGSKPTSDHMSAMAVDWTAPTFGSPYEIAKVLAAQLQELVIWQLIYECMPDGRRWVHTSCRLPAKVVNRVITIHGGETIVGIQEV